MVRKIATKGANNKFTTANNRMRCRNASTSKNASLIPKSSSNMLFKTHCVVKKEMSVLYGQSVGECGNGKYLPGGCGTRWF